MRLQSSKKEKIDTNKDSLENKLKYLNENIEYDINKANGTKRNLFK